MGGCSTDFGNKWFYDESRDIKNILSDSGLLNSIGIKIGDNVRSTAGSQVITGVGFLSSCILLLANDTVVANKNWSVGFDKDTEQASLHMLNNGTETNITVNNSIFIRRDVNNVLSGSITAIGADGFTITWALTGAMNGRFIYLCLP